MGLSRHLLGDRGEGWGGGKPRGSWTPSSTTAATSSTNPVVASLAVDPRRGVGTLSNMKALCLFNSRVVSHENAFVQIVIWRLPAPLRGSSHPFKYRLALIVDGVCVLRYDNEAGKGDHRHVGAVEQFYAFVSPDQLMADFQHDVQRWHHEHGHS